MVAGLALQLGRLTLDTWAQLHAAGPVLPDQALGLLASAAGTGVSLWLLTALTVSTVAALSSRSRLAAPAARHIAPAAVRNAVAALLGVVLIAAPTVAHAQAVPQTGVSSTAAAMPHAWGHTEGLASPSLFKAERAVSGPAAATARARPSIAELVSVSVPGGAFTHSDTPTPGGRQKLLQTLSPGWTPERPRPTATASPTGQSDLGVVAPRPRRSATSDGTRDYVVVLVGDTLWSIASRHLGPTAGDAEIAREWPRWYRVNRHLIGADPHRLLPGERLRSPHAAALPRPGASPSGTPQPGSHESGAHENGARENGAREPGTHQSSARENGTSENGTRESGTLRTNFEETGR
ncbi:LysM peptidoglycan-binding domain-containing protein [Kineosporia rhizophila]|uniref:LysM peptidoglycan-binding domain-containing protein n=1 Tax=Kineosporia TaxID=49184 RepID=UPI001E52EAAF|nr:MULTISPECIES: LysM domain-containing protein [Kineosporia]MCE0534844.1 LysM peptidoglycan-binding domain-containing protein [Kineosporia rhizophila]GLY14879.1 hypothetical protein Kisp01_18940 [Kineosporia sp. NBRC 101677]